MWCGLLQSRPQGPFLLLLTGKNIGQALYIRNIGRICINPCGKISLNDASLVCRGILELCYDLFVVFTESIYLYICCIIHVFLSFQVSELPAAHPHVRRCPRLCEYLVCVYVYKVERGGNSGLVK